MTTPNHPNHLPVFPHPFSEQSDRIEQLEGALQEIIAELTYLGNPIDEITDIEKAVLEIATQALCPKTDHAKHPSLVATGLNDRKAQITRDSGEDGNAA